MNRQNPIINFDKSNLIISKKLIEWKPSDGYSKGAAFLLSANIKESMSKLIEEWNKLLNNSLENSDIFNYSYPPLKRPKIGDYKLGFTYSSKEELIHKLIINKYIKNKTRSSL